MAAALSPGAPAGRGRSARLQPEAPQLLTGSHPHDTSCLNPALVRSASATTFARTPQGQGQGFLTLPGFVSSQAPPPQPTSCSPAPSATPFAALDFVGWAEPWIEIKSGMQPSGVPGGGWDCHAAGSPREHPAAEERECHLLAGYRTL